MATQTKPSFRPIMPVPLPDKYYKLNLPNGYLSYSQIDTYLRCPEKYRRQYVLGIKPQPSAAQLLGSAVGAALEQTIKAWAVTGEFDLTQALNLARQIIQMGSADVKSWDDTSPQLLKQQAEEFLTAYWKEGHIQQTKPAMIGKAPAVEYEFNVQIAGVPVKGFIDLLEDNYVWDYKCVKNSRYLSVDTDLQLTLYAVAMQRSKVGYIVFQKEGSPTIELLHSTRDLLQGRALLEHKISQVAMGISLGVFPMCSPTVNTFCSSRWCEHWNSCAGFFRTATETETDSRKGTESNSYLPHRRKRAAKTITGVVQQIGKKVANVEAQAFTVQEVVSSAVGADRLQRQKELQKKFTV